jgi:hypothetical protein
MISDISLDQDFLRVFTVGLGLPEFINAQKLQDLATVNGGYFQVTEGNDDLLPKFFVQILSDVSGQQIVLDPQIEVDLEREIEIPFYLSDSDFNATFVLTWEHGDSVFECLLIDPDGRALDRREFWHLVEQPRYQAFRVPVRGTRWEKPGRWHVRIRLIKASVKRETAFLNVMVASENQLEWKLVPQRKRAKLPSKPEGAAAQYASAIFPALTRPPVSPAIGLQSGQAVQLVIRINEPGLGSKLVGGIASVQEPTESFAKLRRKYAEVDLDRCKTPPETKERPKRKWRDEKLTISKSGQNGFVEVPLSGPDGFYQLRVQIEGVTRFKNRFQRERYFQLFVRP